MSKTITIKLASAGSRITGPFNISDNLGNILGTDVLLHTLITGISYIIDSAVSVIVLESTGKCSFKKNLPISQLTKTQIVDIKFKQVNTASIWRHLTNIQNYNYYYGNIEPYIIEYPFAYQFQDEILQNVKDFTRSYKYLPIFDGVFNDNTSIEVNEYFNKAVLYNGQQSSGILKLVAKPERDLSAYLKYPIYSTDSKTITYTKSDNFYQYNTFWSLVKDKSQPLFNTTCESLSIDKVVNQTNMDYGKRSFKKEPLRAKFLKVRHILDDRSTVHLVSGFIVSPAMISYK